jgi:hypothetical protein
VTHESRVTSQDDSALDTALISDPGLQTVMV